MQLHFLGLAALLCGTINAQSCTAERRIQVLKNIITAFNEKNFTKSLAMVDAMPLAPDCHAFVSFDGLPGIEFGPDATMSFDFSNIVRQEFQHVIANYTDYGNGTTLLDAIVTLGVLHYVPIPVYAHIVVPIEFDMENCLITELPAFVYVPTDVMGHYVDPPIFPAIPGLATIPPNAIQSKLASQGLVPGQLSPNSLLGGLLSDGVLGGGTLGGNLVSGLL